MEPTTWIQDSGDTITCFTKTSTEVALLCHNDHDAKVRCESSCHEHLKIDLHEDELTDGAKYTLTYYKCLQSYIVPLFIFIHLRFHSTHLPHVLIQISLAIVLFLGRGGGGGGGGEWLHVSVAECHL